MKHFLTKFLLKPTLAATLLTSIFNLALTYAQTPKLQSSIQKQFAQLETAKNGRLGISAINTANKQTIHYRANERFPFCSTSKFMVVSAILKQSEIKPQLLQERIKYKNEDIVSYSPITEKHLNDGMTIAELCAAAINHSDSTAMNLLIKKLGGPNAINDFAHSIGDHVFTLNRLEPELNTAIPGDIRDTTSPLAMQKSLYQLGLGNLLSTSQKTMLQSWLKSNTTGDKRIRAALPKSWIVGDKTGSGDYGTTNDIAIIWPPKCAPIVMALYFTQKEKDAKPKDAVITSAAQSIITEFAKDDQCLKKGLS